MNLDWDHLLPTLSWAFQKSRDGYNFFHSITTWLTSNLEERILLGPKEQIRQFVLLIHLSITYSSTTDRQVALFTTVIASLGLQFLKRLIERREWTWSWNRVYTHKQIEHLRLWTVLLRTISNVIVHSIKLIATSSSLPPSLLQLIYLRWLWNISISVRSTVDSENFVGIHKRPWNPSSKLRRLYCKTESIFGGFPDFIQACKRSTSLRNIVEIQSMLFEGRIWDMDWEMFFQICLLKVTRV